MKCRSEPQVVESRTFRIASWGLTIVGSLTVSVLMSLTPFQQIARMVAPRSVVLARAGGGVLLERRDLAGLEEGLRAVQRLDDQGAGDRPLWRGRRRVGRLELEPHRDRGPVAARRGAQADLELGGGPVGGAGDPSQEFTRALLGELGVQLQAVSV